MRIAPERRLLVPRRLPVIDSRLLSDFELQRSLWWFSGTCNDCTDCIITDTKLATSGTPPATLWQTDHGNFANVGSQCQGLAIRVGGSGNVFVDGAVPTPNQNAGVRKRTSEGVPLWLTENVSGGRYGMELDASEDVYLAVGNASIGGTDFTFAKYSGLSGSRVWEKDLSGLFGSPSHFLTVLDNDAILVHGFSSGGAGQIRKFNTLGSEDTLGNWPLALSGITLTCMCSEGNTFFLGGSNTSGHARVRKYDSSANLTWEWTESAYAQLNAITSDGSGGVYLVAAAGSVSKVIHVDSSGSEDTTNWPFDLSSPSNCLARDGNGDVYVGLIDASTSTGEAGLLALDSTGSQLWFIDHGPAPNGFYLAVRDVAVGPSGNVHYTGGRVEQY